MCNSMSFSKKTLFQERVNTCFTHGWLVSAHRAFTRAKWRTRGLCDDVSGSKTVKDTEDQRTRYQGAREVSGLISKCVYFIHLIFISRFFGLFMFSKFGDEGERKWSSIAEMMSQMSAILRMYFTCIN